jgi:regulatory protein
VPTRRRPAGAGSGRAARAPLDAARARAVALELLARRAWTRRELGARLRRRGAPAEVAEAVVTDLEARRYVDDRAYAATWAASRAGGRAIGSRRLRQELLARGVARPLVDEAVRGAFVDADEEARARAAAERRLPALRGAASGDVARRLAGYLLRRGYPSDVVRRVVRRSCGMALPEE